MTRPIPAAGEAMPAEHPWAAARRLAKELSSVLDHCDNGGWHAHVFPSNQQFRVCFAGKPDPDAVELPVDKVNRLAWELADALNEYADGRFHARIYPSEQATYAVMFAVTTASERGGRS